MWLLEPFEPHACRALGCEQSVLGRHDSRYDSGPEPGRYSRPCNSRR